MKKIIKYIKNVWLTIWLLMKKLGSVKGVISFVMVWLIISGSGLIAVGILIQNGWLIGIGTSIYAFWLLPLTPLIPLNLALSLLVQRYVLMDKKISFKQIKKELKNIYSKKEQK